MKTSSMIIFVVVLIGSFFLAAFSYRVMSIENGQTRAAANSTPVPTLSLNTPVGTGAITGTPTYPPVVSPGATLGIVADTLHPFAGIPWVRLGYGTCFGNVMKGQLLQTTIAKFHSQGVRVMLSVCQWATDKRLYNTHILNDAAQGGADAVQCGNEQLKMGR